ncbi:ornithine racemase Orr [Haloimpatiens lingqiaonensis]|uniref:ornithine racemase Orr n=1 Tax=Haloimpatiens lingqiaonensis TaxID=1380675 RepID=UPI0010FD0FDA|nr:ornithine racemase Orr [Haloimpatiens lingqiaonensis]
MGKNYPCIEINLNKITHNAKKIVNICSEIGIHVVGVTKVFCAERPIVESEIKGGVELVGDSRLENLIKMKDLKCRKMLLRIPMERNSAKVVKYSDISLNSEFRTIKALSRAAKKINKIHAVILMVDVGDLREGVLEKDVLNTVKEIITLPNIKLCGIGTNLTCYGGVIPDENNLGRLVKIKDMLKEQLNLNLPIISGGNSSSIYLALNKKMPEGINQLRIGEAIVLGRETAFGEHIEGCYSDCFILKGEIVEIKEKPSIPVGNIGMDAFGHVPHFDDKGIRKRAIVAMGRQDISVEGTFPIDKDITVLGGSSDHLILDVTDSKNSYNVGDVLEFNVDYGCLLQAMTSPYIKKYYIE